MKNIIKALIIVIVIISCNQDRQLQYPFTKEIIVIDTIFNTKVEDPYRWLENDKSLEVKDWINEQNKLLSLIHI